MYIPRSKRPYIGITDFESNGQVAQMLKVFRANRGDSVRRLHVGVMMSRKTLFGEPTKWANVFPSPNQLQWIFQHVDNPDDDDYVDKIGDVMFCLHYADYERPIDLFSDLMTAIERSGNRQDALQLDMIWPEPAALANANDFSRNNMEIILQVGANALEQAKDDPQEVVERLRDYKTVITHVLLDKSMGKGLGMDAQALLPFARAIKENFPELGLVVAGGLGPSSMDLVRPILQEFPDVSIDAQGRLRPSGSALDSIDWKMAEEYLIKALELLK